VILRPLVQTARPRDGDCQLEGGWRCQLSSQKLESIFFGVASYLDLGDGNWLGVVVQVVSAASQRYYFVLTCRTRAVVALVRQDVYRAKGSFVPPKSYEKHGNAGTIAQILDPPAAESMSSRHSLTSDVDWQRTHFKAGRNSLEICVANVQSLLQPVVPHSGNEGHLLHA
jgi:hypothetical protein